MTGSLVVVFLDDGKVPEGDRIKGKIPYGYAKTYGTGNPRDPWNDIGYGPFSMQNKALRNDDWTWCTWRFPSTQPVLADNRGFAVLNRNTRTYDIETFDIVNLIFPDKPAARSCSLVPGIFLSLVLATPAAGVRFGDRSTVSTVCVQWNCFEFESQERNWRFVKRRNAEETIEKFRISAKSLGCFNGDANLLHAPERDFHSFYREFDSPEREQILELRRCLAKWFRELGSMNTTLTDLPRTSQLYSVFSRWPSNFSGSLAFGEPDRGTLLVFTHGTVPLRSRVSLI